jgi:phage shock protein A
MGIFSRFNDIVNSNINALLERAENPEKIIRLVIQEMEDTLVEVRTNAARTIADQKTLTRRLERMYDELSEWDQRAELALQKNREDLARSALTEKTSLAKVITRLEQDRVEIEEQRQQLGNDIGRLQEKLAEAKARKKSLLMREDTARSRIKTRGSLNDTRVDEAMANFEHLERKMDTLEGKVESYDLGRERSLEEEFVDLAADEGIEQELAALKKRMQQKEA